jgi:hypothetical protein
METSTCMSAVAGRACTATNTTCSSIQLNPSQCSIDRAPIFRGDLATWSTPTFLRTEFSAALVSPNPWTQAGGPGVTTSADFTASSEPIYITQQNLIGTNLGLVSAAGAMVYYNTSSLTFPRWSQVKIESGLLGVGNYIGIVFRLTDSNNFYSFEWATNSPNVCLQAAQQRNRIRRIKRTANGVATVLWSDSIGYDTATPMSRVTIWCYEVGPFDASLGDVTQIIVHINGVHWTTISDNAVIRPRFGSVGLLAIGEDHASYDYLYVTPIVRGGARPVQGILPTTGKQYAKGETYYTFNVTAAQQSATSVLQLTLRMYDSMGNLAKNGGLFALAVSNASSTNYGTPPLWRSDNIWDPNIVTAGNGAISATVSPDRYEIQLSVGGPIVVGQYMITIHNGDTGSMSWEMYIATLPVTMITPSTMYTQQRTIVGASHYGVAIPTGVSRVTIIATKTDATLVDSHLKLYATPGTGQPYLIPRPGVQGIGSTKDFVYFDANATADTTRIISFVPDTGVYGIRFSVYVRDFGGAVGGISVNHSIIVQLPTPVIASISSVVGLLTSGGSPITISGRDFLGAQTTSDASSAWPTVRIGGVICPLVVSSDTIQSQTQLVCLSPVGTGRNLYVLVTTPLGLDNSNNPGFDPRFSYDPPTVQPPTPANGPTAGGLWITLQGSNFGANPAAITVRIDGGLCTNPQVSSHSLIRCLSPPGRGSSASVTVDIAGQTATASNFGYFPPQIVSFSPLVGASVGTILSIVGNNFGPDSLQSTPDLNQCNSLSGTWVKVGSMACTPISNQAYVSNHTNVYCQLPSYVGTQQVSICVSGQSAPAPQQFIYSPPEITSLNPDHGPMSGTIITLVGKNFGPQTGVFVSASATRLDGQPLLLTSAHISDTSIVVIMPSDYSNQYQISVGVGPSTASLSSSNYQTYLVDAPQVISLVPPSGPSAGGITLTIFGDNFAPAYDIRVTVSVNDVSCPIDTMNLTCITCQLPAGAGGNKVVKVTRKFSSDPREDVESPVGALFSYNAPIVSGIMPITGSIGSTLTISGSYFGISSLLVTVMIGGYPCTLITLTDNQLTCKLSSGEGSSLPVYVTVDGQSNSVPALFSFNSPLITSSQPLTAHTDGTDITDVARQAILTIYGTDFGISPRVVIGTNYTCIDVVQVLDEESNTIHLECKIPRGEGSLLDVRVLVGDQRSPSLNWQFRFSYAAPHITLVSPTNGAAAGGYPISLNGNDFGTGKSDNYSIVITPSCIIADDDDTFTIYHGNYWLLSGDASYHINLGTVDTSPKVTFVPTLPASGSYDVKVRVRSAISVTLSDGIQINVTATDSSTADDATGLWRMVNLGTHDLQITTAAVTLSPYTGVGETELYVDYVRFCASAGESNNVSKTYNGKGFITSHTSSQVQYNAPSETGRDQQIVINVAGQASTYDSDMILFSYDAPTITSVSGCDDIGTATTNCGRFGLTPELTITGSGFGSSSSNVAVFIATRDYPCYNVEVIGDTQLTCTRSEPGDSAGFDVPVIVQAGGQVATARLLSFTGPSITTSSLRLWSCNNPPLGNIEMNDTIGGIPICFNAVGVENPVQVQYGYQFVDGTPTWFECTQAWATGTQVTCLTSEATGRGLVLRVSFGNVWSRVSTDTISYPVPVIVSSTIRSLLTSSVGQSILKPAGQRSQGDWIVMDVKYLPDSPSLWSLVTVSFAQSGGDVSSCASVSIYGVSSRPINYTASSYVSDPSVLAVTKAIRCRTSPGTGSGYHFTVNAFNTGSLESTDSYTYPDSGPFVKQILGCAYDASSPSATINCPTSPDGSYLITLIGDNFCNIGSSDNDTSSCNPKAMVGSRECIGLTYPSGSFNATAMVCKLPNGNGIGLPIFLIMDGTFAVIETGVFISYSSANITGVSGCDSTSNSVHAINCPSVNTGGSTILTIDGQSFGPSGAIVMVGPSQCTNVIHDAATPDRRLRCVLPNGRGSRWPISVLQLNGAFTASTYVMISYKDCDAGSIRSLNPSSTINCTLCNPGKYSATSGLLQCTRCTAGQIATGYGATACVSCSAGTFSSSDGISCLSCAAGRSSSSSASICSDCAAGSYGSTDRLSCISCLPSTYSASAGASSCVSCAAGYETGAVSGSVTCTPCTIGTYSLAGNISCTVCPVGKMTTTLASTSCTSCQAGYISSLAQSGQCRACDSGKYAPSSGSSVCSSCRAGTFAVQGQSSCKWQTSQKLHSSF